MTQEPLKGTVRTIKPGFGFIKRQSAPDIFFHKSGLRNIDIMDLPEGATVEYAIVDTDRGPAAVDIYVI